MKGCLCQCACRGFIKAYVMLSNTAGQKGERKGDLMLKMATSVWEFQNLMWLENLSWPEVMAKTKFMVVIWVFFFCKASHFLPLLRTFLISSAIAHHVFNRLYV